MRYIKTDRLKCNFGVCTLLVAEVPSCFVFASESFLPKIPEEYNNSRFCNADSVRLLRETNNSFSEAKERKRKQQRAKNKVACYRCDVNSCPLSYIIVCTYSVKCKWRRDMWVYICMAHRHSVLCSFVYLSIVNIIALLITLLYISNIIILINKYIPI